MAQGARERVQDWDGAAGVSRERDLEGDDAFAQIERETEQQSRQKDAASMLEEMYDANERHWADPYSASQTLRRRFREQKRVLATERSVADAIRKRNGLQLDIAPAREEDAQKARLADFDTAADKQARRRLRRARHGPVMGRRGRGGNVELPEPKHGQASAGGSSRDAADQVDGEASKGAPLVGYASSPEAE